MAAASYGALQDEDYRMLFALEQARAVQPPPKYAGSFWGRRRQQTTPIYNNFAYYPPAREPIDAAWNTFRSRVLLGMGLFLMLVLLAVGFYYFGMMVAEQESETVGMLGEMDAEGEVGDGSPAA